MKTVWMIWLFLMVSAFFLLVGFFCCGDDDDTQDDDESADDDDTADDDNDDNDDDDGIIVPTTLDLTLVPVESPDGKKVTEGPGEPHILRNDLSVVPTRMRKDLIRLSMSYFTTISDLHQTDEESPTRLSFLHAWTIMFGSFESFFRPHEDLTPHLLNALVRTINHLQAGYGRDFDFGLVLGDGADNGQKNEIELLIDILDGAGLTSGSQGIVRPDSGDLYIDQDSGLSLGERNFGVQETDGLGNNTNPYTRPEYPHSNADFASERLVKSDGSPLPWFYTIGNHDVLSNGGFDPDGNMSCSSRADYIGDHSSLGFIPGIGAAAEYMDNNPGQPLRIGCGLFGQNIDWQKMMWLFRLGGDWSGDIDPRFDLAELINITPEDPSDDGVTVTPDANRVFMGHNMLIQLLNDNGHGFADNNNDMLVNAQDGGWYRTDWAQIAYSNIPLRLLVLDTTDVSISAAGGISQAQLDWLSAELEQAVVDRVLLIVISHHNQNQIIVGHFRLTNLLNGCPNVILHLVGHGHENAVTPHPSANGDSLYGYWEVQTPSNRDFPQQSRIFEIVDNRDGTGSIYSTLYDFSTTKQDDPDMLAILGRELSVSEWEWSFSGMGSVEDRNVEMLFAIPSEIAAKLKLIASDGHVTSIDSLGKLFNR